MIEPEYETMSDIRMLNTTRLRTPLLALMAAFALAACGQEDARADMNALPPSVTEAAEETTAAPVDTIDLRTIGYARGSDDAPLTVIEFSDFGCPFCASFSTRTYPDLHEEYVATGKVRWVFVPFVMGTFPNGELAARTAECAAEQDRFWEMKEQLYAGQDTWKSASRRQAPRVFTGFADDAGLEPEAFSACFADNPVAGRIAVHNRAADAMRIRATPSFLVNGRLVEGALPIAQFRMALDRMVEDTRE
jgi:protein-disulfide isomerase